MNRPPDIRQLMQQAQEMQRRLIVAQEELAERSFEGSAGGGAVTAVVSGDRRLLAVRFDPDAIDPSDPELMGDLVVAAVNTAMESAAAAAEEQLNGLDGGLGGLLG